MRTEELMREYQQGRKPMPPDGWEKIVWLAAEMIKTAKVMRNTYRERKTKAPSPYKQEDLFNN